MVAPKIVLKFQREFYSLPSPPFIRCLILTVAVSNFGDFGFTSKFAKKNVDKSPIRFTPYSCYYVISPFYLKHISYKKNN
jgi:hypothetical protein